MASKFKKFLEFIGITEENPDGDDYDEDYTPREEEEYTRGRGRNRAKEEPEENEAVEEEEEEQERGSRGSFLNRNKRSARSEGVEEKFPKGAAPAKEPVERPEPRTTYNPNMKVMVYRPVSFEDTQNVIDNVKDGKPVIVNLSESDEVSAIRVLDFLSGATYAIDGSMCRVAGGIFFISPKGCDVVGGDSDTEEVPAADAGYPQE